MSNLVWRLKIPVQWNRAPLFANDEERFWWLRGRFSVHKVDVIESIIVKHFASRAI
jgi:hypothetical protein